MTKDIVGAILRRIDVRILAAQFAAVVVMLFVAWGTRNVFVWRDIIAHSFWPVVLVHALVALALSAAFGLRRGWLVLGFVLPVVAWLGMAFAVPSWVYLLTFFGLLLIFSNAFRERVPLYLSNRATRAAILEILHREALSPHPGRPVFIDLGCGLGGLIASLSRACPDWDFVGVETAPLPYVLAKLRVWHRANAQVRYQSLWATDLSRFDVVYAFLSPAPMARLLAKAVAEMLPQSLFVSNSFWDEDTPFDVKVVLDDSRQTHLVYKRL